MIPGDKVKRMKDGAIGRVLAIDGEDLVVEVVPGDVRRWKRSLVVPFVRTYAPRGLTKVSDRVLEAARLKAEGWTVLELALRFGISTHTVANWLQKAREALEEARHAAAAQR